MPSSKMSGTPPTGSRHHRQTCRHAFEHGDRHTLGVGGQDEQRRLLQEAQFVRPAHEAGEIHGFAQGPGQRLDVGRRVAAANHEPRPGMVRQHRGAAISRSRTPLRAEKSPRKSTWVDDRVAGSAGGWIDAQSMGLAKATIRS